MGPVWYWRREVSFGASIKVKFKLISGNINDQSKRQEEEESSESEAESERENDSEAEESDSDDSLSNFNPY